MNIHDEFMEFIHLTIKTYGITKREFSRRLDMCETQLPRMTKTNKFGVGINKAYVMCIAAETSFEEFCRYLKYKKEGY